MGKGGVQETKQTVELPPEIKKAALKNLGVAENVAALPYVPNFGLQMAAFTPSQEASFANTNSAASAFGLPTAQGTGLPKPETVGGFSGYSTQPLYEDAMSRVPAQTRDLYNAFFTPQGREAMGADSIRSLLGYGPGAPGKSEDSGDSGSGNTEHPDRMSSTGYRMVWDPERQAYKYATREGNASGVRRWFTF